MEDVSFSSPLINSNDTEIKDPQCFLKYIRMNNINRLIIGQLNINSLRNKFEQLSTIINGNTDIFMISETKLDETFVAAQFYLQDFCNPYRFDGNRNGGGIMLYIREDIVSRLIEKKLRNNSEYVFVEINLRNKKWLLCCSYNSHKNSISTHIDFLRRELALPSSSYEDFISLGDFNSEMTDANLKDFCNLYLLKNLIKKPTCFKNPENPKTIIDLLLTNRRTSFCNSDTLEN